ncbi:MAG: thermonuclease family protein [Chloroflexota bacterium]|nr:thermonuclease family protein [Chloroflexota bacterium]
MGLVIGAGPEWARRGSGANSGTEVGSVTSLSADTGPIFSFRKSPPASGGILANFNFCHSGAGTNCVVDGDTLWLEGQKIRIADIDAPETHDYGCLAEKELGDRATQRLLQLVNGGSVSVSSIERDEDPYGRKLRIVMVDGVGVGDTLVSEGLARYYGNGRKPWC